MQCENGYTKPGVKGILCKKAENPIDGDLRSTAHALCGHQRFCPNQRCYQMLPGWEKCPMRREKPEEAADEKISRKTVKSTAAKKRTQKAK